MSVDIGDRVKLEGVIKGIKHHRKEWARVVTQHGQLSFSQWIQSASLESATSEDFNSGVEAAAKFVEAIPEGVEGIEWLVVDLAKALRDLKR